MPRLCCHECGKCFEPYPIKTVCPSCSGFLLPMEQSPLSPRKGKGVWRFSKNLASTPPEGRRISLGEGDTPLIPVSSLAPGKIRLYVKDESRNPTGTFIDRGAATLVTAASCQGYRKIVAASLGGDLAVSLGAYARRAGLGFRALLPRSIDLAKAYQILVYADRVDYVDTYEEVLRRLSRLHPEATALPVSSSNPYLLDGYKTLYYEIYLELGNHPDVVVVPMGDGALLTALWLAARDLGGKPRFIGVRGCADTPLLKDIAPPKPLMISVVRDVLEETGGFMTEVCEEELLETIRIAARSIGLLLEPVGVDALAAARRLGADLGGGRVVAIATGGPLRDSAVLRRLVGRIQGVSGLGPTKTRILEIIVARGPIHPYEVWRILQDAYKVRIGLKTLYQHVKELEAQGYIVPAGRSVVKGRVRVLYRATDKAFSNLGWEDGRES